MFAKFYEILSMICQDIKETKRYGRTFGQSVGRMDNVKTVYPPTNTVCGGYKNWVGLGGGLGRRGGVETGWGSGWM